MFHSLQEPVNQDIGWQLVDGNFHPGATFWTQQFIPLGLNILQAFSAECVLAWENFVGRVQLLEANGTFQNFSQIHIFHLN